MRHKILIVDDEPANLRLLELLFSDDYETLVARSAFEALAILGTNDVGVIISDQRMHGMTGLEFLKNAAKISPHSATIILTGFAEVEDLMEAINSGVVNRYVTKPWVDTHLMTTVREATAYFQGSQKLHLAEAEVERLENRLQESVHGCVKIIRELIAQKSSNLAEHCRRTSNYAVLMGERLKLSSAELEHLVFAGLLHEVPNVRLPFEMAFQRASLTTEQYKVTRNNYENGLRLISRIPDLQEVANIICYQHEHYDGSGFFVGLEADKIPLMSRILSVANAFDELNSGRNPALFCTDEEAADWLRERAGTEFDPEIVELCLSTKLIEPIIIPIRSKIELDDRTSRSAAL